MFKCNKCRQYSLNKNRCTKCGAKIEPTDSPQAKKIEIVVKPKSEPEPVVPQRTHGFARLGAELGDPEMAAICDKGAQDIPLDHPVERMAETVADTIAFSRTPGGALAFEGIKKGIAKLFGG